MKKGFLFGIFVLLLLPLAFAIECDEFCAGEGYNYGICRDTVEAGFCEGNTDEKVFGFSQCTNVQRCCCGNDDGVLSEDPVESEESNFSISTFAENIFWFLLAVVAILGIAVIISKVAFSDKDNKKEEDKKDEEKL